MIGIQIHTLTRANCGIKNHVDVEISKKEKEGGITSDLDIAWMWSRHCTRTGPCCEPKSGTEQGLDIFCTSK